MHRSPTFRLLLALLLPFFFLVTACDSGGSNEEEDINNSFSFSISPTSSSSSAEAVPKVSEKDLNGFSFFIDTQDIDEAEEQAFAIYFNNEESFSEENATEGLFGFVARASTQPGTGSYTLTSGRDGEPPSSDFIGLLYEDMSAQSTGGAPFYVFESGTLELTTSNDNEVSGQITATATAFSYEGSGENLELTEEEVEITGNFTAENLNTYIDFGQFATPSGS